MSKSIAFILGFLAILVAYQVHADGSVPTPVQSPAAVQIPNDPQYWTNSSFAEMVPPLREPSDRQQSEAIRVWLKIPADQKISASWIAEQNRYSLVYPAGAIADRVDSSRDPDGSESIDDVRGARIDEQLNTIFHVYETAPNQNYDTLFGYEWLRNGDQGDAAAADALVALYFPAGPNYNWDPNEIQRFRMLNRCAECHQPNAPAPLTTAPPFRFESDTRGFFQPMTVLDDTETVRDHRNWDLNADDPYITVWCGNQQTHAVIIADGNVRKYFCPNDVAPVGKLDMKTALAHQDAHALQVCQSRAYLYQHMDATAQKAYDSAFKECGIGPNLKALRLKR